MFQIIVWLLKMDKLDFDNAIEQLTIIKSSVDELNKKSCNQNKFIDTCVNVVFDAQMDKIKEYVDQLENELKNQNKIANKNLQIKQMVARTYSWEQKPVGFHYETEELQKYLNEGYHVVMANKICKGVVEYILQKEVIENGKQRIDY